MVSPWAVRAASAAALLLVSASAQLPVASPQPIQYVGWIYTGCTTATTELDKFDPIPFTAPIDVEDCIAACETDSYVYSVLYGGLCACGKATDLLAPVKYNTDNSLCNFACPKNSSEACGGSGNVDTELTLSYSFYSKASVPQPIQYIGWVYTGCTTATTELDKFDPIPFTAPIDVEDCIAACETDSYVYSVLYGGLCACGKATDLLAPVKYNTDNSLCNFACPKNSSEACGGSGNVDTELTLSYSFYSKVGSAPTNMTSPKNVTTSPPIVYTGGAAAQKITTTRESFGVLSLLLALAIF